MAESGAGGLNAVEASDGTPVVVSLTGTSAVAGDTVTVNWGGQTVSYTLVSGDVGAGSAAVTVPQATIAAQGDGTFNVSAKITDIAGNVSATSANVVVAVDTAAPLAPAIMSIAENAAGGINAAEASNGTPVIVNLAGTGAVAGDTVTVSWGGQVVAHTLLAADIGAGSAAVNVPAATITAQGNGTFSVTAKVTDIAGNVGASSTGVSVTVDTVAPNSLAIVSIVERNSGGINAVELADGTPIQVDLFGTAALAGDTVTVTWGSQIVTYTLLASDIAAGLATVSVPAATITAQGDGTFAVVAKLTDIAGNVSANSPAFAVTVDTVAPGAPAITSIIENGDGGISAADVFGGTPVVVSLAGTGALADDILTLFWGGETISLMLDGDDVAAGSVTIVVPLATIRSQGDGTFSVTARLTDAAGNLGATSSAVPVTVDTVAPGAPTIVTIAENDHGAIDAGEVVNGTPVEVSLAGTGALAGDTLTVNWGAQSIAYTLADDAIVAGVVTVTISAAALAAQGDGTFSVTARLTDTLGNTRFASAGVLVTVDTAAPVPPSISAIPENAGGGINASEAADGTPVVVDLAGTGALAGDTLTVIWGTEQVAHMLLAADVAAGTTTVTVAPSVIASQGDGAFVVSVKLTDAFGNASYAASRVTVSVNTAAPGAPSIVSIVEALGHLNGAEASDGTPVVVSLAGSGAASGDTLTVMWGGQAVTHTLSTAEIGAANATVTVSAETIAAQGDGAVTVTATLVNSAGNTGLSSPGVTVTVDTDAPGAPTVVSVAENDGGGISHDEAADGTPVVVSLAGTGAVSGDTLTLGWGGQTVSYTLAAGDVAGGKATVAVSAATIGAQGDGTVSVTAKITDAAGNVSSGSPAFSATVGVVSVVSVVSIATSNAVAAEGDGGTSALTFTVSLDHAAATATTVDWNVVGSGLHPADFIDFGGSLPSGTVSFDAGETSAVLTVLVSGDSSVEFDESFDVVMSDASAGLILGVASATGVILNDDKSVVSLSDLGGTRTGSSIATTFNFTVTLDRAGVADQMVEWSLMGTAVPAPGEPAPDGPDPTGTLLFAAGETSKTVSVQVPADTGAEFDQGFVVNLSNASSGLTLGTASAIGTVQILGPSIVSVAAMTSAASEGNSGLKAYSFMISLDHAVASAQSIGWNVTGSDAHGADASDFAGTLPSGIVTFNAGDTAKTVTVLVSGDDEVEFDESFAVTLSKASSGLTLGESVATATIINDDKSTVSVSGLSASQPEGDGGVKAFTFTVSLAQVGVVSQTVGWSVIGAGDHPADASDFVGVLPSGIATFNARETSQTVTVLVTGDSLVEFDEGFSVVLANPSSGLMLGASSAGSTIQNDDRPVASIAVDTASKAEGDAGPTSYSFTVTLDQAAVEGQTVSWSVAGTVVHGAEAQDFGGTLPSGTLSFAPGDISKTIVIDVAGDTAVEVDEGFTVGLSSPSAGLALGTATADALIRNDDVAKVSIAPLAANGPEGNSGLTFFTFTVSLDQAGVSDQTVAWNVTGSGATAADPGDFGGTLPAGSVVFEAGATSETITVAVSSDAAIEPDEAFQVVLSNASAGLAVVGDTATGTIRNDDATVSLAAAAASQAEGNSGANTSLTFTLTLAGDGSVSHAVDYAVTGAGASPASAGDFAGGTLPSGTVLFEVGVTSKTLIVQVAGDVTAEPNEAFTVTLSNPSTGLSITGGLATGTILNDDTGGDPVLARVVANDDIYTTLQGQALHVVVANGVLFNDEGVRPLTASLQSGPAHGTVAVSSDGSFDYAPNAGFAGVDSFIYGASGAGGNDTGLVTVQVTPVSTGSTTTLNLLSLTVDQQIAAVYTAFFGRGADAPGFDFWVGDFNARLPTQTNAALLGNIASAFGVSDEAKALYPFLVSPFGADDSQINAFLDTVYDNLFARTFDSAGLAYWSGQIKQRLAAGQFVGSVLVDIMNGAQNTADGRDISTLMGKVTVNLEYVHDQKLLGSTWTQADDGAEAKALIHAITADPNTVLVGIAQAKALVQADVAG
ncbi:MAG: Calx-beta domain-containing protein [Reyranellaceae bacterium]